MTVVLYPGSFDPVHNGHVEIVETAARLFDKVVVAAMRNPQKGEPLFDLATIESTRRTCLVTTRNIVSVCATAARRASAIRVTMTESKCAPSSTAARPR